MKQKFFVSVGIFIEFTILALFFIFIGLFTMGVIMPFENPNIYVALSCFGFCIFFIIATKHLVGTIIIDEDGIAIKEIFIIKKFIDWKDVKDIGIGYNSHVLGTKWIYISKIDLTNIQKNKIEIVKNTKKTIKFIYKKKRIEIIKNFVEKVNYIGKIELDDKQ